MTLTVESEGFSIPWSGFFLFDNQGYLASRILNPNQDQTKCGGMQPPSLTRVKQRFVSGREFIYRRQRKGLVVGHIIGVVDYTNYFGKVWLLQDLIALFLELLS